MDNLDYYTIHHPMDDTSQMLINLDYEYGTQFYHLFNLDTNIPKNSYNKFCMCYIFLATEVIYQNNLYYINTLRKLKVKNIDSLKKYKYGTVSNNIVYPLMDNNCFDNCNIL